MLVVEAAAVALDPQLEFLVALVEVALEVWEITAVLVLRAQMVPLILAVVVEVVV